jgi:hypothetical protein
VDVVLPEVTPLEADLSYPEHPIKILDQKDCVTRHKTISSSRYNGAITLKKKQLGRARTSSILATGLRVAMLRNVRLFAIPVRIASPSKSRDEISVRGGCDTPCL